RLARRLRQLGLERLEHVELGVERVARVQVVVVLALPEERLAARHPLDVVGDDPAALEDRVLGSAQVGAAAAHDTDLGEGRGREGEGRGCPAKHPLALPERRLDGVEGDGSDDGEAHGAVTICRRPTSSRYSGAYAESAAAPSTARPV